MDCDNNVVQKERLKSTVHTGRSFLDIVSHSPSVAAKNSAQDAGEYKPKLLGKEARRKSSMRMGRERKGECW